MSKIKDLVGNRYGLLTVVSFSHIDSRRAYWNCNCDCGGSKVALGNSLKAGDIRSCGCLAKRLFKTLVGKKFGRLLVLQLDHVNPKNYAGYWLCLCDCGIEKIIDGNALKSGATVSCGCFNSEKSSTHRMSQTRTYTIHCGMKQRCKNMNIKNYGARGIKVCDRWKGENGFIYFLEDMGECPEGHELDRINNDGDYEPSNCRWVTRRKNARNRGNNTLLTYKGETKCKTEWSEQFGISCAAINTRLRYNWSLEKIFTTPVKQYKRRN